MLQLGVDDVVVSKDLYIDRGLAVSRSYGKRYAQFDSGAVTLALTTRKNLAKAAGISADRAIARLLTVHSNAAAFADPNGFSWTQPA